MRKFIAAACLFLCFYTTSSAQFYKAVLPSPEFTKALEDIVLDFRFNFKNIQGSTIVDDGATQTFESTVALPGVNNASVTYYNSKLDTTASWQGIAYSGTDYGEAVTAYQNLFRLVKKSRLNWIDHSLMRFQGELQPCKEAVGFSTSILKTDLEDDRYKKFVAQVELMNGGYDNWEVHISLQNKKSDIDKF